MDPEEHLYLLINSRCYNETTDILVEEHEVSYLTHESYIETGDLHYIFPEDILGIGGSIRGELRQRICRAVMDHGVLPPIFMAPVLKNLCGVAPVPVVGPDRRS